MNRNVARRKVHPWRSNQPTVFRRYFAIPHDHGRQLACTICPVVCCLKINRHKSHFRTSMGLGCVLPMSSFARMFSPLSSSGIFPPENPTNGVHPSHIRSINQGFTGDWLTWGCCELSSKTVNAGDFSQTQKAFVVNCLILQSFVPRRNWF